MFLCLLPLHCLAITCDYDWQWECDNGLECVGGGYVCSGKSDCSDGSDEWGCTVDNCTRPGMWLCQDGSKCLRHGALCNFWKTECDDGSDESPETCEYCAQREGWWLCEDGSRCLHEAALCNGLADCPDFSDEISCGHCNKTAYVQCPGLSDYCIPADYMCDGFPHCPDQSDETLDPDLGDCRNKCQSDGHLACGDGSVCVRGECNGRRECSNNEDEQSQFCPPEPWDCSHPSMFPCSEGGCVSKQMLCSAKDRKEHICNLNNITDIGSDMDPALCSGKCFFDYPDMVDSSRRPCQDGSMCLVLSEDSSPAGVMELSTVQTAAMSLTVL